MKQTTNCRRLRLISVQRKMFLTAKKKNKGFIIAVTIKAIDEFLNLILTFFIYLSSFHISILNSWRLSIVNHFKYNSSSSFFFYLYIRGNFTFYHFMYK